MNCGGAIRTVDDNGWTATASCPDALPRRTRAGRRLPSETFCALLDRAHHARGSHRTAKPGQRPPQCPHCVRPSGRACKEHRECVDTKLGAPGLGARIGAAQLTMIDSCCTAHIKCPLVLKHGPGHPRADRILRNRLLCWPAHWGLLWGPDHLRRRMIGGIGALPRLPIRRLARHGIRPGRPTPGRVGVARPLWRRSLRRRTSRLRTTRQPSMRGCEPRDCNPCGSGPAHRNSFLLLVLTNRNTTLKEPR